MISHYIYEVVFWIYFVALHLTLFIVEVIIIIS